MDFIFAVSAGLIIIIWIIIISQFVIMTLLADTGAHHFTKVQFTNISFPKSSFHKSSFHKNFIN